MRRGANSQGNEAAPNGEVDVLVLYSLDVEADRRNGGDNFTELQIKIEALWVTGRQAQEARAESNLELVKHRGLT